MIERRTVDTGIVRRNKTYLFTVSLGMDSNHKQIRKTTTWTPPEGISEKKQDKLAKEAYLEFKNKCRGRSEYNENMRFNDLAADYFKIYAPNKLKPVTEYNYKHQYEYRFKDYFGNKKLKDITTSMLNDFFNGLKVTKKDEDGNRIQVQMNPSTVKRIYDEMASMFRFAVKQRYIRESPCDAVILPSKDVTKDDEHRYYLEENEIAPFLELFNDDSQLSIIVKILLLTGMRSGELLGLQWDDIDFENRTITVNHTLADCGGGHFLTTPKTKTSRRVIGMGYSSSLYDLFQLQKQKQEELQICLNGKMAHPEMVFTSELGNYKDRSCLLQGFKRRLKGTQFSWMTLHKLRHTNATLLLNSGTDIKIISEHLGHSNIEITSAVYADVLQSTRQKVTDTIDTALKEDKKKK